MVEFVTIDRRSTPPEAADRSSEARIERGLTQVIQRDRQMQAVILTRLLEP
nr:hypothetical protein [Burkholderia sp. WAC0059]